MTVGRCPLRIFYTQGTSPRSEPIIERKEEEEDLDRGDGVAGEERGARRVK